MQWLNPYSTHILSEHSDYVVKNGNYCLSEQGLGVNMYVRVYCNKVLMIIVDTCDMEWRSKRNDLVISAFFFSLLILVHAVILVILAVLHSKRKRQHKETTRRPSVPIVRWCKGGSH